MIEVENLTKRYGYITAVKNISLELNQGEVLGLIGPNGAGKTTTLKTIVGLVVPDSGRILIDNINPFMDPRIKRIIGYVPEIPQTPEWTTVCGFLENLGLLEGLSQVEARRRARQALEEFGVGDLCNRKLKMTSKGQRKRILLAQSLLVDKKYMILDEPISGLDPEWVVHVRNKILEWARSGVGVLVSSHILKELQDVVDRVVIIAKGKKVFEGTLQELGAIAGVSGVVIIVTPSAGEAAKVLEAEGIKTISVTGRVVKVQIGEETNPKKILEILDEKGIQVEGFEYREASLEEAYLKLVRGG
ncbi:MAG: ABC transporter ATP-binding protein [Desulfurococcales archaeon]|nr:ABC transporter ATP-binding protein [Desulfurococcales archaeon]